MDLRRVVVIVRIWLPFLVTGTLVGAMMSVAFSFLTPSSYAGRATLLVTPLPGASGIDLGDVELTQALAPTFAALAITTPLLERAIARTGVTTDTGRLARAVTTNVPPGTSLLEVTVSNADASAAATLANAIASELTSYPTSGLPNQPIALNVALVVVNPATVPTLQQGLDTTFRVLLGAVLALLLTTGFASLIEVLRTWRSASNKDADSLRASRSPR